MVRKRKNSTEEIIEFHSGENCYEMVRNFHKAFNHPWNNIPTVMDAMERVARAKWMAEETLEYIIAEDSEQIEQVDALIDLLYFTLGTYVILGIDPYDDGDLKDMKGYGRHLATILYEDGSGKPPADRLYAGAPRRWRAESGERLVNSIFDFALAETLDDQIDRIRRVLDYVLVEFAVIGADPYPYFVIVHDANMQKLWPDGKPRYSRDGKILKPVGYTAPNGEMTTMMLNDLDEETEHDEVPF